MTHRHLYTQPDKLDDLHLRRYAKEIGLDLDWFDREMNAGTYTERGLRRVVLRYDLLIRNSRVVDGSEGSYQLTPREPYCK